VYKNRTITIIMIFFTGKPYPPGTENRHIPAVQPVKLRFLFAVAGLRQKIEILRSLMLG
jgi:hypothetical protein